MGSKEDMNLGGERSTNTAYMQLGNVLDMLINKANVLRSIGAGYTNQMAIGAQKITDMLTKSGQYSPNYAGGPGGYSTDGSGNTVMYQPPVAQSDAGGGMMNNVRRYVSQNRGEIAGYMGASAYAGIPSVNDAVAMDYMIKRSRFFGAGGGTPSGDSSYEKTNQINYRDKDPNSAFGQNLEVQRRQQVLVKAGTANNPLDAPKAMLSMAAGGIGMTMQNDAILRGVGQMSNLTPGVGIERTAEAFVNMQAPRNVNMLRFIGISARDPITGQPKSPTDIAEQLWQKMNRQMVGSEPISTEDLDMGFLPGNSLDSMMRQYFGNDEVVISQVKAYFYAKAAGVKKMTKKQLKKYGATSDYVEAQANRTAEAQQTLQQTSGALAAGAEHASQIAAGIAKLNNQMDRLIGIFQPIAYGKGFVEIIKSLPFFGGGKAEGGPVTGTVPYLVGERGPELFVPKISGTILPNHKISRGDGGDVSSWGANVTPTQWAQQLATGLGIKNPSGDAIDALTAWMRHEGGHWKNSASFNPLNTTFKKPGSESMNSVGVQAYDNWQIGLQATIDTLTGKNAEKRGYAAIISAIRSGDKDAIFKAINNSAWRTGETGGAGAYKGLAGSRGGDYGYSSGNSFSGQKSGQDLSNPTTTFKDWLMEKSPWAMKNPNEQGSGGNTVTININGYNKNAKELAKEVAKIINDPTSNSGKG